MENKEAQEPEEPETDTGEEENEEDPAVDVGIKIVINVKGNRATVGVQSAGCDPVFGMVEGNRAEIAQGALRLLSAAEKKWKANPRYPKSDFKPIAAPTTTLAAPAPARATPQNALF